MKKRKTPIQQLVPLLNAHQRTCILGVLMNLSVDAAEDLALALVAYIRFGIRRQYQNTFLQVLFESFVDLVKPKPSNF